MLCFGSGRRGGGYSILTTSWVPFRSFSQQSASSSSRSSRFTFDSPGAPSWTPFTILRITSFLSPSERHPRTIFHRAWETPIACQFHTSGPEPRSASPCANLAGNSFFNGAGSAPNIDASVLENLRPSGEVAVTHDVLVQTYSHPMMKNG